MNESDRTTVEFSAVGKELLFPSTPGWQAYISRWLRRIFPESWGRCEANSYRRIPRVRKPSDPTLSFRLCQKKEGENDQRANFYASLGLKLTFIQKDRENAQLAGLNCHLRGKSDCFPFFRRIHIEDNRLAVGLKEEKWAFPLFGINLT